MEERRKFFRVKSRKLTSLVVHEGAYEFIEEDAKSTSAKIDVKDISTGGLSLKSKYEFPKKNKQFSILAPNSNGFFKTMINNFDKFSINS